MISNMQRARCVSNLFYGWSICYIPTQESPLGQRQPRRKVKLLNRQEQRAFNSVLWATWSLWGRQSPGDVFSCFMGWFYYISWCCCCCCHHCCQIGCHLVLGKQLQAITRLSPLRSPMWREAPKIKHLGKRRNNLTWCSLGILRNPFQKLPWSVEVDEKKCHGPKKKHPINCGSRMVAALFIKLGILFFLKHH